MMRVVFYHVGQGDLSLVLLPNGQAMLVDCYKANEAAEGMLSATDSALDRIAHRVIEHKLAVSRMNTDVANQLLSEAKREQEGKQKIRIWTLAITHGDRDHILSKKRLLKKFEIEYLMDNGREYADPSDALKDYLAYREDMRRHDRYIPIRKAQLNLAPHAGVEIDALCPNRHVDSDEDPNNQCLVLRFSYNSRSFLFAGDTQVDDWVNREYGILRRWPQKALSDVLNVSHHGSRTFFTPPGPRSHDQPEYEKNDFDTSALRAIRPKISFITCSDDEEADHPDPIALEIYRELTNPAIDANQRASHVYLSRDSGNMHFIVDDNGDLYCRTARSRCDSSQSGPGRPHLTGVVSSPNGFKNPAGIWVVQSQLEQQTQISFTITRRGIWGDDVEFDWHVLNNGQGSHALHHELYVPTALSNESRSRGRPLVYRGVHLMQCHARTADGSQWADWCCPVCFASSLTYAHRWLALFPNCIDPSLINP